MDTLQAAYRDDDEEDEQPTTVPPPAIDDAAAEDIAITSPESPTPEHQNGTAKPEPEEASDDLSESVKSPDNDAEAEAEADEDDDEDDPPPKKQKQLSSLTEQNPTVLGSSGAEISAAETTPTPIAAASNSKKSKKKNNNVWVTKSTRKGKKKSKSANNNAATAAAAEDTVLIAPVARFPDKTDDSPETKICLSKVYKAEKVELGEDRLSAGSTKGYRMVRATRGVVEGAWYFEIKVVALGETGHTRLGWSTEKADLQAPVGYDGNSFGYRDIDGTKVHKALREKYGEEGYKEGDVIGFYINLPGGAAFAPKDPRLVVFKGQRYACAADSKDGPPKVVPGESFFSFFSLSF